MALAEELNGKKVQDLINDSDFIKALVPKLAEGTGTNGIYTKKGVDDAFVKTLDLETPTVAEKILGAQDGKKSILVEKLGGFLDSEEAVSYDEKVTDPHTARDFLSAKVGPSVDAVAEKLTGSGDFKANVIQHALRDTVFENAVRNTMSKPVFEIPENDNAPLSWDW